MLKIISIISLIALCTSVRAESNVNLIQFDQDLKAVEEKEDCDNLVACKDDFDKLRALI